MSSCAFQPVSEDPNSSSNKDSSETPSEPLPVESSTAHFVAVGDLLVERPILYDAQQKDGSFYFDPLLAEVKHLIYGSDFAYANQETPITGAEFGLGDGYFVFNNPYELGHLYHETGFNMLQLVNNHTLDMDISGLARNIEFWQTHYPDVLLSGAHIKPEDREYIPVIEKNGISIALISSTYKSNLPVTTPHSLNIFTDNEEQLIDDVSRAREVADLVVVGMHWGQEYAQPTPEQQQLAKDLAKSGADIIIGHHPHVLQPIEWIDGQDGQKTLVAYSLGNFISGPFDDRVPHLDCDRLTGALLGLTITKTAEEIAIDSLYAVPTYTSFSETYTNFQVKPLDDFEEQEFRWCDLPDHKKNVHETLTREMEDIEIQLEIENEPNETF
ncbi:CapA family protein [Jeotgalibacillus soli]|nr:CapA family protein [Jeotgalibacillus soli]